MRIGDRIAIMQGGVVVQVGTPEEILKNPANDYVRSFFRGVDVSKVLTARDIARRTQVTLIDKPEQGPRAAIRTLETHDREYGYVLGRNRRFLGVASLATLDEARKADRPLEKALLPDCPTISPENASGRSDECRGDHPPMPCPSSTRTGAMPAPSRVRRCCKRSTA